MIALHQTKALTLDVRMVAGGEELERLGGSLRCLEQTLALNVLACGLQQVGIGRLEIIQSWQANDANIAYAPVEIHLGWQLDLAI